MASMNYSLNRIQRNKSCRWRDPLSRSINVTPVNLKLIQKVHQDVYISIKLPITRRSTHRTPSWNIALSLHFVLYWIPNVFHTLLKHLQTYLFFKAGVNRAAFCI